MNNHPSLSGRMAAAAVLLVASFWIGPAKASEGEDPERVIVHFTALDDGARGLLRRAGGTVMRELPQIAAVAARVPAAAQPGLARNPKVALVEPDARRYPSSDTVPWGIDRVGATAVWDADGDGAFDPGAPTGSGLLVCVVDSGISTAHPDLSGLVVGGYPSGWNTDGCGHGTHVAGTIAARLDGNGVVGVAPDARLYAVKVFGNDCRWTYASDLVDAAYRCRAAGARVINMSLGGSRKVKAEERAFKDLFEKDGILSVAAAGNNGSSQLSYPASYDSVVSVAAVDSSENRASFSQYNAQVELAAPGVGVLSTVPWSPWFESWNGTSMATPHVAGVAALAWSAAPGTSVVDLRQVLRDTARDLASPGRDNSTGFGLVQAQAAVAALGGGSEDPGDPGDPGDSNGPPTVSITSPAPGTSVEEGTDVLFTATASDPEDGDVSASLQWTSDRDGFIGAGASFSTASLSANTHVVTATATDSEGLTASQAVTLTVNASGGQTGDTTPPVVSNVSTKTKGRNGSFEISWSTNEPADSRVRFTCCGEFTSASLTTSHKMPFTGTSGATYEFFVSSADASGNVSAESGPHLLKLP